MKVAALAKLDDGCAYYRVILPLDYMNIESVKIFYPDSTTITDSVRSDNIKNIDQYNPDIVFYNRSVFGKSLEWIQARKRLGTKFVLDIDDYWELSSKHLYYDFWYKNNVNVRIIEELKLADLVLTTNERLQNIVRQLNKNCIVIPNSVPFSHPAFNETNYTGSEKTNFLYAGGSTHFPDLQLLQNKFDRIGSVPFFRERAIFTLAGYNPLPSGHCQWDRMASIFKRTKSYQILDTLPLQDHMSFYDKASVVLVPLVRNEFNQYKSVLKIIEAATRNLPCIVSNVPPYSDLKNFPGILWENWVDNIKYCINNPTFVTEQGKALREQIEKNYELTSWAKARVDLFKNLAC